MTSYKENLKKEIAKNDSFHLIYNKENILNARLEGYEQCEKEFANWIEGEKLALNEKMINLTIFMMRLNAKIKELREENHNPTNIMGVGVEQTKGIGLDSAVNLNRQDEAPSETPDLCLNCGKTQDKHHYNVDGVKTWCYEFSGVEEFKPQQSKDKKAVNKD